MIGHEKILHETRIVELILVNLLMNCRYGTHAHGTFLLSYLEISSNYIRVRIKQSTYWEFRLLGIMVFRIFYTRRRM